MQVLRGALISAMLLGCGNDSSEPVQPEVDVTFLSRTQNSASAAAAAADHGASTRGFYVAGLFGGATIAIGTDFTEIQKFSSLPPGDYIANASAVLASNDPEFRVAECIFTVGGVIQGELARGLVGGTGRDSFLSLPLTIGFTLSTPTDLGVACRAEIAGTVFSQGTPITAVRIKDLTVQP